MLQNEIAQTDLICTARGIKDREFQCTPDGVAETFANVDALISRHICESKVIDRKAGIGGTGKRGIAERCKVGLFQMPPDGIH